MKLRTKFVKTGLDYSRMKEPVYKEVPPYAVDPDSGEFLNKTANTIFMKTGEIDIYEKIQSFCRDCDLYTILEKFALSEDSSLLNKRPASFADIVDIPDNVNDFGKYVDSNIKKLSSMNKDVAQEVIKNNMSSADIEKMVKDAVAAQMIKAKENEVKE